jgi:hypothetical protein
MGHIIKHIMGEGQEKAEPKYQKWTIEVNSDGKVHIHLNNIRMDLTIEEYNQFHDVIKVAHDRLFKN